MTTKQLTTCQANEQLKSLYQSAFPVAEQIPWKDLMRLVEEMPLDFTSYYDGDIFIGFTIVYPRDTFNWFWYFAVCEELRGKGYGQQILSLLIERYKSGTNIMDMESPDQQPCDNIEQRKRRHAFYLRNGFRDTYICRSFDGVTYTIMMNGNGTFTQQDYDDIIADLQRFWRKEEWYIRIDFVSFPLQGYLIESDALFLCIDHTLEKSLELLRARIAGLLSGEVNKK